MRNALLDISGQELRDAGLPAEQRRVSPPGSVRCRLEIDLQCVGSHALVCGGNTRRAYMRDRACADLRPQALCGAEGCRPHPRCRTIIAERHDVPALRLHCAVERRRAQRAAERQNPSGAAENVGSRPPPRGRGLRRTQRYELERSPDAGPVAGVARHRRWQP